MCVCVCVCVCKRILLVPGEKSIYFKVNMSADDLNLNLILMS